jgi:hypothetical protein
MHDIATGNDQYTLVTQRGQLPIRKCQAAGCVASMES